MAEVIRFPEQAYCDDCGKPLEDGEGTACSHPGCTRIGCDYCTQQSDLCLDHIGWSLKHGTDV